MNYCVHHLKKIQKKMTTQNNYFQEFNKFQQAFFTDQKEFSNYTHFELKKFGYILINNLAKGFPNLADIIINLKGLKWSSIESPALMSALQRRFVNQNVRVRVPQFVYFKNLKPPKEKKKSVVGKKRGTLEFDTEIKSDICNILMYDSKTYEQLKYSDKIQQLGKLMVEEHLLKQQTKRKRKN